MTAPASTFEAPPIRSGQAWVQALELNTDLGSMHLIAQFRRNATGPLLLELTETAGIQRLSSTSIQLTLTGAQTALLAGYASVQFAIGRSDGGKRDVSHVLQWPVKQGFTR